MLDDPTILSQYDDEFVESQNWKNPAAKPKGKEDVPIINKKKQVVKRSKGKGKTRTQNENQPLSKKSKKKVNMTMKLILTLLLRYS